MWTYHVLADVNTQGVWIVGHGDTDTESNCHADERDAKNKHVSLAVAEEVCRSVYGRRSSIRVHGLRNQDIDARMAKHAIPTPVNASFGT